MNYQKQETDKTKKKRKKTLPVYVSEEQKKYVLERRDEQ